MSWGHSYTPIFIPIPSPPICLPLPSVPSLHIPTTHRHLISVPKRPGLQPSGYEIFNPLGHFLINLGFDTGHCASTPASITLSWIQLASFAPCPGDRDKTRVSTFREQFAEASATILFAIPPCVPGKGSKCDKICPIGESKVTFEG